MPKVERSATVLFSDEQMFDLVNDVEQYPQFLPLCIASRVLEQSEDSLTAELTLAKLGIQQSFATRNHLERPSKMDIELLKGPFKHLVGHWAFIRLRADACKVVFELDFEVKGLLLSKTLSPLLEQVASLMVDSFCKRAEQVYASS
jgi:ribosome-associated toxin RatA of RatAB toxin-antitoxin module